MKNAIACWWLLSLPLCGALAATQNAIPKSVKTDFSPGAHLAPTEIQTVLQLARRCGVRQVARIETYNIHPSPHFGIIATSPETVRGREVSFTSVNITRKQWSSWKSATNFSFPPSYRAIGDFWVEPGDVYTNRLTLFTLATNILRIELRGVRLPTADRIFEAFAKGNVRFSNDLLAAQFKNQDLSTATAIGQERNSPSRNPTYVITFTKAKWAWMLVSLRMEGNEAVVIAITDLVA